MTQMQRERERERERKLVLQKLEEFATQNPNLLAKLIQVGDEHGVNSESGGLDTLAEHWIKRTVSAIFSSIKSNTLNIQLRWILENSQRSPYFSSLESEEEKLLLKFFDCVQELADSLGVDYNLPSGARLGMTVGNIKRPTLR